MIQCLWKLHSDLVIKKNLFLQLETSEYLHGISHELNILKLLIKEVEMLIGSIIRVAITFGSFDNESPYSFKGGKTD